MKKENKLASIIFLSYIFIFTGLLFIIQSSPIDHYIETIKMNSMEVNNAVDPVAEELKKWAHKIERAPIDARIDRVWKAIPGLNGIKLDFSKSYQLALKQGKVNEDTLVLTQIPPAKQLSDLPPNPIYRGNPEKNMVSFMVNVAWGTENVPKLLDIFEQYQVKSTFFLDGTWLQKNKQVAQEIVNRGHEIGNHAYSHPDMVRLSEARMNEEILKTEQLIKGLGQNSAYFAPPSGSYDHRVVKIAHQHKMKLVLWTLDTIDWQRPTRETIINRIVPKLENGALILMHPTASTVEALPEMIEAALAKQLFVGTVSELLSSERVESIVRQQ